MAVTPELKQEIAAYAKARSVKLGDVIKEAFAALCEKGGEQQLTATPITAAPPAVVHPVRPSGAHCASLGVLVWGCWTGRGRVLDCCGRNYGCQPGTGSLGHLPALFLASCA
jgi:hypothetical protein